MDRICSSITTIWSVDGVTVQTGIDNTLDGAVHFVKNQTVSVTATPNDGNNNGAANTNQRTISNTPPTSPGLVFHDAFGIGIIEAMEGVDDIRCIVQTPSTDVDNDTIAITIAWDLNGIP